jgi:hypothetical protein
MNKLFQKLPSWDEISKNIPFIITGSIAIAFILMSHSEKEKLEKD